MRGEKEWQQTEQESKFRGKNLSASEDPSGAGNWNSYSQSTYIVYIGCISMHLNLSVPYKIGIIT